MTAWRTAPLPPDWTTYHRPTVLARDGYTCQIRGPRCTGRATEVDHKGANDDHRLHMLQAVCTPCHRSKTGRQARAARPDRRRKPQPHPGLL